MGLNPVGSFAFQLLDGAQTVDGVAGAVAERFGVDVERARADVVAFLEDLRRRGLVEADRP